MTWHEFEAELYEERYRAWSGVDPLPAWQLPTKCVGHPLRYAPFSMSVGDEEYYSDYDFRVSYVARIWKTIILDARDEKLTRRHLMATYSCWNDRGLHASETVQHQLFKRPQVREYFGLCIQLINNAYQEPTWEFLGGMGGSDSDRWAVLITLLLESTEVFGIGSCDFHKDYSRPYEEHAKVYRNKPQGNGYWKHRSEGCEEIVYLSPVDKPKEPEKKEKPVLCEEHEEWRERMKERDRTLARDSRVKGLIREMQHLSPSEIRRIFAAFKHLIG